MKLHLNESSTTVNFVNGKYDKETKELFVKMPVELADTLAPWEIENLMDKFDFLEPYFYDCYARYFVVQDVELNKAENLCQLTYNGLQTLK